MEIELARRSCFCRLDGCEKKIFKGEERVNCIEFYYGYAHPNCALKIINNKIKYYTSMRDKFVEKHETELVADEL